MFEVAAFELTMMAGVPQIHKDSQGKVHVSGWNWLIYLCRVYLVFFFIWFGVPFRGYEYTEAVPEASKQWDENLSLVYLQSKNNSAKDM